MKKAFFLLLFFTLPFYIIAQSAKVKSGFEITINLKNCKDTIAYLNYYEFGNKLTAATCKVIKNGKIIDTLNNFLGWKLIESTILRLSMVCNRLSSKQSLILSLILKF